MEESFYKESIVLIEGAITEMLAKLDVIKKYKLARNERVPIEYITTRVKTEESMKESRRVSNGEIYSTKPHEDITKYSIDKIVDE